MKAMISAPRQVVLLTNAEAASGVGHYALHIRTHMPAAYRVKEYFIDGQAGTLVSEGKVVRQLAPWPGTLAAKTINWLRLGLFLRRVLRRADSASLFHATNQTLSFVTRGLAPAVVTVHDLIELMEPQSWGGYASSRYLYSGIRKAQHIVAVSEYTSACVQERLGVPAHKITVIPNGVGDAFGVIPDFESTVVAQSLRHELRLPGDARIVLYVGSEHSRKNAVTAVRAFAQLQAHYGNTYFLKVGEAGLLSGRDELMREIDTLGIRDRVIFMGLVTEEKLCELYNLADVFVFPSRLEGFGLPPLQAMACGTPVVTSNAAALPAVVGEAALLRDPDDVDGFASDMLRVLEDEKLAADLRQKGIARAKFFSWDTSVQKLMDVYKQLQ